MHTTSPPIRPQLNHRALHPTAWLVACLCAAACGGSPEVGHSGGPVVLPPPASTGDPTPQPSTAPTGGDPVLPPDPGIVFMPSEAGGGAGSFEVCSGDAVSTEKRPVVLQLVVDTSLSMDSAAPGSERSKWEETRDALLTAIDALPAEASVGLVFYPDVPLNFGGEGGGCFDRETDVSVAKLDAAGSAHRLALAAALGDQAPDGATPTHDAYVFALDQLASVGADANQFVVLITDGVPTFSRDCAQLDVEGVDPTPIIAEATHASELGVRTFVIGSPGSEDARNSLSAIAREGGTAPESCVTDGPDFCHFDMTTQADFAGSLAAALDQISEQVLLGCSYDIPPPPGGRALDPTRVNVKLTLPSGETTIVPRDPSESDCTVGWQYAPTGDQILLCGETCELAKQADVALALEFGCRTRFH